jgi:hypothetical protein
MSLIQIKTSIANSAPTTLELGEQGYSYVSNTLFIGTANGDGVLAVGGKAYIDRLNSSYAQANTGTTLAQAAFNAANNVGQVNGQAGFDKANSAFDKANSANNLAQAGFDKANTKLDSAGGSITGNITITGNIIPSVANTYFLGSALVPFHSLFVGPGSVNIDGIILSNTDGSLGITSSSGNTIINFSGSSITANAAFDKANSANVLAQAAFNAANIGLVSVNGGAF